MAMRGKLRGEAADGAGRSDAAADPVAAARARIQQAATAPRVAAQHEPAPQAAGAVHQGEGLRPRRRPPADRKPFGAADQQLYWPPVQGMRLYWFNDTPGRVGRAKAAGYDHVLDEAGAPVARNVGRGEGGQNGLNAFLMQIPEEWYLMDKKEADDALEARLTDIRRGRTQNENQYVDTSRHRVEMASQR